MGKLAKDQAYVLLVKSIEDSFDSFIGGGGSTTYCHKFILVDPEFFEEFPCQWCTEYPKQNFCQEGDKIKIQVKNFTKNLYTITPLTLMDSMTVLPSEKIEQSTPVSQRAALIGESIKFLPNPMIAGTVIDRAMTNAITYFKDNEAPFEKVTKYADEIYDWYIQKLKQ